MSANEKDTNQRQAKKWLTYRPEIKVLDCTIRDGGLMNDHMFGDEVVRAVYQTCVEARVDYMEIGYKGDQKVFAPDKYGNWKHSGEEDIRRILGDNDSDLKISVMADAERTDYHKDILPKNESVIDLVRVACYIHQLPTAMDMVKDANDKGYETTINLMAVSTVQERELDEALEIMAESEAGTIIIVDSFGAFYSEQVRYLVQKYLQYARPSGKEIGIHAHNNQMLAYANTIEAVINGVNMLDASVAGLGRGAGNCPLELLLGFLHNPKYHLRPVLKCIQEQIEPMREELGFGYDIPYMITGLLNQHPRSAIAHNASADKDDIVKFFDSMEEEE